MLLLGSKGGADHVTVAVVVLMDTTCSETGESGKAVCVPCTWSMTQRGYISKLFTEN